MDELALDTDCMRSQGDQLHDQVGPVQRAATPPTEYLAQFAAVFGPGADGLRLGLLGCFDDRQSAIELHAQQGIGQTASTCHTAAAAIDQADVTAATDIRRAAGSPPQ